MYEFILYNRGSSHMITGDSLKLADYLGIEPGTLAFDAKSDKIFIAIEDEFVEVAAAAEETTPDVEETPTEPVEPEAPAGDEEVTEPEEEETTEGEVVTE